MPITINGTGTVTGISAGGLPDACITTDDIAANAVTAAKLGADQASGLAKAWVNFDGTGTVAIRASFNVSSITDNGTGDYTVNFTTALADANYAAIVAGARGTSNDDFRSGNRQGGTYSTTAVQVFSGVASQGGTYVDANPLNVAVFR
jgi:hypothetical protein